MNNPWEEIKLDDYENHMKLDSVKQLKTLNDIMKEQFETFSVKTAMVFGVAGGNGLEHVSGDKYNKVFGVDINQDYLDVVSERYKNLSQVLECLKIDLINESEKLPEAQLVIANLLIEYIGYEVFKKAILRANPEYVSCTIQINKDVNNWVSDSPYLHAFDRLDEVHCQMNEDKLDETMHEIGYGKLVSKTYDLPNGKAFIKIDYRKTDRIFESDFAKCEYIEKDNVVFHIWKKEAHFNDYRNPVTASLCMLREHKNSIFIVDARNGFEDVKEDVEWGFEWFLPELKKTGCKYWGFILPRVSEIEGEIDLWTKEVEKNFTVIRAESYEDILKQV